MTKLILIVDDSALVRTMLSKALSGAGYEVLAAVDGQDALAKLREQKAHLVISDVNMPKMNGLEFVREMRLLPNGKFTPVIMLTTESATSMQEEARAAGVKAWMVKPFNAAGMLAAVGKLVPP